MPVSQDSLRASTMFIRAARSDGRVPPTSPMVREKRIDWYIISPVRVKEKASSEKVCQFVVDMVKFS